MFEVKRLEDGRIQITGKKVAEFVAMTNFSQPEAVDRLRNTFKKIGLEKALLKEGVETGAVIVVSGKEFEWSGGLDEEVTNEAERIGGYSVRESKAQRLAKRKARREKKAGLAG
jgi:GTP-binding protein